MTLGLACPIVAQVITPLELNDPKLHRLQQKNFRTLIDMGGEIQRYKFPYPFYLSRVLDVDLGKMKDIDQPSIRFDSYKGETVLEITGNYYVSYSELDAPLRRAQVDALVSNHLATFEMRGQVGRGVALIRLCR